MAKRVERVTVRQGYDLWAETYDATPNPIVAMDARHSIELLAPKSGERVLDAGCGTGRNLTPVCRAGGQAVGLDFSLGMLRVARFESPNIWDVAGGIALVQAAGGSVRQQRDGKWEVMKAFAPEQPSLGGKADLRFWRHPIVVGVPEAVEYMCAG